METAERTRDTTPSLVRVRMRAIENDLDTGAYRPGPWSRLLAEMRNLPIADRGALAEDVSRISRKLHLRHGQRMVSATIGYALELLLTLAGLVLLAIAVRSESSALAIVVALVWTMTLQPLIKVGVGYTLGIRYEYAYLYGVEPRFKMRFGDYVARPRWARIVVHVSGMIGSPLGAWLPTVFLGKSQWLAIDVCLLLFWIVMAINLFSFIAVLSGVAKRIGSLRLADGSGGAAALELREALEIAPASG